MHRFAIIGAGAAGLAAVQQLRAVAGELPIEISVFERRACVGGLWNYEPQPGPCHIHQPIPAKLCEVGYATSSEDPQKVIAPSAMYEGLRTNVPSHFASSQSMLDVIRFRTEVVHARRVQNGWHVTSRSLDEQSESNDVFDAILVANGNCATPHIPSVPGLDHFRGRQMHSAWYRYPDTLNARRILIVGSNSSGSDIARELCGGAVRQWRTSEEWQRTSENVTVYQSYHDLAKPPKSDYDPRDPASPAWCRRIHVVGPIQHIDEQGALVFSDGARLEDIDLIIWATGFLHNVSFFQANDEPFCQAPLIVHNQQTSTAATIASADTLHHLDDWMMFYKPDPSLCFIGLPKHVVPFPLVQLQSRIAAHVLLGKIPPLPRVRAQLPISDPERWIIDEYNEAPGPEAWGNFILGREAEFVYTDTLLSLLPRSQPPEWQPFPPWRRELRRKGIEKRRELLGY